MQCIFCRKEIKYGNNSEPLSEKPCCSLCNIRIVMPARIAALKREKPKVILEHMDGEPQMKKGLTGTINLVDDIGQIHVNWENGSTLAINAEVDIFSVV